VGLAALQIARALGGHVMAAVGSDDKLAACLEHGAHEALSTAEAGWEERVKELTGGKGADVVIESVGGDVLDRSLKHLAWDARVVIVGFSSGDIPEVKLNRVMLKHVSLVGLNLGGYHAHAPEVLRSAVTRLFELRDAGVRAVVHATYPLERAGEALTALAERRTTGKVVLIP
jgi:NADPH2:quinone reductase